MANSQQYGAFVPTNYNFDAQQLLQVEVTDPVFKELLVRLYQNVNNIALVLNIKDTGMYQLSEFVNGQLFFPNPANNSSTPAAPSNRQVIRKILNILVPPDTLPNTGTISRPHGITCNTTTGGTTFTRIYGAASDTTGRNYIPIPYASPTLANNIELSADMTNVYITTGSNRTNFNICYVILEFLQT